MKAVAAIAAFVLVGATPTGAVFLIAATVERPTVPLLILSSLAVMALTVTPILAGSIVALSLVDPKLPQGRRYFQRLAGISAGTQLLGAIGIVVFAIVQGAPSWLPVSIIAAGAVLTTVSILAAEALRRREAAGSRIGGANRELTRQERNRKARGVAITFAVTLVVASAVMISVMFALLDDDDDPAQLLAVSIAFGITFAFLAASIACLVVGWPLVRALRDHLGPDPKDHRLLKRVVVRGKSEELDAEQSERAVRYAVVLADFLPFQLAQFLLLYAALLLQQGISLLSNPDSELRGLTIGLAVFLLAVLITCLPIFLRQFRRVRNYAADHRHLTAQPVVDSANDG
jgi:hypothetical protein